MARKVTVTVGTPVPPEEAKKLDKSKIANLRQEPPNKAGVEGQYSYEDYVICPGCGMGGWAWVDSNEYTAIYCGRCGGYFYA